VILFICLPPIADQYSILLPVSHCASGAKVVDKDDGGGDRQDPDASNDLKVLSRDQFLEH
jgi:hypothetical protein